MKKYYSLNLKTFRILSILMGCMMCFSFVQAQVLNPADPIVTYNPSKPPATPANNTMAKWVITPTISGWSTSQYKAYFYNMPFRLLYPPSYKTGTSTKYPLIVFFHGLGEKGTIYNNDYQLYHGGQPTLTAENNGTLNAFCIFPQSVSGVWGPSDYQTMIGIINYMVANAAVDPQRIIFYGLSGGGQASWDMADTYPTIGAAYVPMSAANWVYNAGIPGYRFTPIWLSQGGTDPSPTPATAQSLVNNILAAGGNIKYSYYPNDGHDTWDDMWNPTTNLFPWMMAVNKANPWALHGQTTFCSSTGISDTLGLTPGFSGYQWMFNGTVISGATSNTYVAKQTGSYAARYLNNGVWSSWSPSPLQITINTATITPPIQLAKLESNILPTLDTSKGVYLTVPGTFSTYSWVKAGSTTVLGTGSVFLATTAGNYQCTVTQPFSCATTPSPIYTVVASPGTSAPNAVTNLTTTPATISSINVNWNYTNSTTNPATGLEIYRATSSAGPYTFLALVSPSTTTYLDQNLSATTTYYYKMRAVNGTGASAGIGPVSGMPVQIITPPSVPTGLVLNPGSSAANLSWTPSTGKIGVAGYYVLVNGVKTYTTTNTFISIYNLNEGQSYSFTVESFDSQGNVSAPSTASSATMYDAGFNYKYFTTPGTWTALADLNAQIPAAFGNSATLDLTKATQSTNYAFLWNGTLHIPVAGSYTFILNSSDGSQVFIDQPYDFTGTPTINNDGVHSAQSAQVTLTLTKGEHKIAVAYFHNTNPASISLSWMNTANGVGSTAQVIPSTIFALQNPDNTTTSPTAPNTLTVADNTQGEALAWKDAGTNNVGYNVFRAPSGSTTFVQVNTSPVTGLSYLDNTALGNNSYQYEVNAFNPFGTSAYSNIATVTTANKVPVLTPVVSPTWQVGTTDTLLFTATPRSGTSLTLSVTGLPSTATFTDKGSGNGILIMKPATADIGTHYLTLKAVDAFNGTSTEGFSISVKAAVNPLIPLAPTSLTAHGGTINSVTLNWTVSANTNLYYIYQSSSSTGPWNLIDSVSGTVGTYLNANLNSNTSYFYQLKSKNASGLSDPSNVAYATTLQYVVDLQFNTDYPAPFPWNHVNSAPFAGLTIANLGTTAGTNSGINVTMTNGFDGTNTLGSVTGNNSGIYPDYVIRGQFYVQAPDTAILTVSGLSASMSYDFVFFTSWANPFGPGITSYVVNGKTVNLDPTNNSTHTVQINNILADQNGNIKITIKPGAGQTFGIINAMVVQCHQIPPSLQNVAVALGKGVMSAAAGFRKPSFANPEISAFPVPFNNEFGISFNSPVSGQYKVSILDLQGRMYYDEPLQTLNAGTNSKNMDLAVSGLAKGIYLIQVQSDAFPAKAFLVNKN